MVSSPIGKVFEFVANPWNAPRYISSINRIISGPEGPPAQGQAWQAQATFLGRPSTIRLLLGELRPPHTVRFSIDGEPEAMLSLRMRQAGEAAHTVVALSLEVPSVPSILLSVLMNPLLAADIERLR